MSDSKTSISPKNHKISSSIVTKLLQIYLSSELLWILPMKHRVASKIKSLSTLLLKRSFEIEDCFLFFFFTIDFMNRKKVGKQKLRNQEFEADQKTFFLRPFYNFIHLKKIPKILFSHNSLFVAFLSKLKILSSKGRTT